MRHPFPSNLSLRYCVRKLHVASSRHLVGSAARRTQLSCVGYKAVSQLSGLKQVELSSVLANLIRLSCLVHVEWEAAVALEGVQAEAADSVPHDIG